jgi:hypothetical protein
MKGLVTLLVLLGLNLACQVTWADEDFKPVLVPKMPERVFTPHGFDSNDNVQVVLDDELASTCYKAGPIETVVDRTKKIIYVRNHNYLYTGCFCAEVTVPYFRAIDLGILGAGAYRVVAEGEDGKAEAKGVMKITLATTAAPDDYLYAPVTEITLRPARNGEPPLLSLRGTITKSCMRFKEVRPIYSEGNVIEVLPIMEMEGRCEPVSSPFSKTIPLTNAPSGRTLVHVRLLNGQSVNQVYSF